MKKTAICIILILPGCTAENYVVNSLHSSLCNNLLPDGIVQSHEQCDDGNMNNDDGCLNNCTYNRCGDGFVHVGVEECETEADQNFDECQEDCRLNL